MRKYQVVKMVGGLLASGFLSVPLWGADTARPGTLNYVEGQASLGTQTLDAKSIGSVELQPGQALTTGAGKAELLLTPGVFLRLGDKSSLRMISPSLTDTEVDLAEGTATVEVTEIHRENYLRVTEDGKSTELLKTGLYDFDADHQQVLVFDGEALVKDGDRSVKVKGGHEVDFSKGSPLKSKKFDKQTVESADLYRWTSLRSSYLAEANADAARTYVAGGPGWYGEGWYWDPWFGAYTFIPYDGIFYSPFGWGFYSPGFAYGSPFFYGRYYHHFGPDYHAWGPGPHYGYPHNYGHGVHYGPGPVTRSSGYHGGGGYRGGEVGGAAHGFAGGAGGFHGGGGGGRH
jgi:hypothetical protein